MIPNYAFPQATIAQVLETTANPLLDRLHAVVVGPAYVHADAAADNLVWGDYEASSEVTYSGSDGLTPGSGAVDQATVGLHGRNLLFQLFSKGTATGSPTSSQFKLYAPAPTGTLLQFNNSAGFLDTEDPSVVDDFDSGRAPSIGDIYRITSDLGTVDRRVTGLVGLDVDASVSGYGYAGALPWTNSSEDWEITTLSSNVVFALPTFVGAVTALSLEARRSGSVASTGGLRMILGITCTGAGTGTSATFALTLNGAAIAGTNVTNASATRFTFLSAVLEVANNAWSVGDAFSLQLDFANDGDISLLTGAIDLTEVTYAASVRRVSSTLVVEVLEVSSGQVTARVSDTSGLVTTTTLVLTSSSVETIDYDGTTIDVTFAADFVTEAHVGQRYTALILPASRSTTVFDKVSLSAPLGMEGATSGVRVVGLVTFTGELAAEEPVLGGTNYTVGADEVTLDSLKKSVSGYPSSLNSVKTAVDSEGEIAISWRALIPVGSSEGLFAIDSTEDIVAKLGSEAMNSELGFALAKALSGSQGKRVYGLNTGGTTREVFQDAILKLEAATYIYAIVVLTDDEDVMRDFSKHAQLSSRKEIKRFRRVYVGTDSPGEYVSLDVRSDSTPFLATITAGDDGYNLVTFTEADVDLADHTITAGDKLRISGTDTEFVIDRVSGENTLVLVAGPVSAVAETAVQIIAADTPANIGRYVHQRSARIGTTAEERRRINNVWVDNGVYDDGENAAYAVPNRFIAAEIAGLRTAVQPQQSLTRTEVLSITDAPSMYTRFSSAVLNEMAANGVWIITQSSPDTVPFVRHQITTEVSLGSLFFEDSAGVNIDSICFAIDDIVEPLIGKRNATARTAIEIKNLLLNMLNDLTESDYDSVLGPQLSGFFNSLGDSGTLDVSLNKILKDTIDVSVILEIPLPLNNIRVTVLARTIRLDGGTVVNSLSTTVA